TLPLPLAVAVILGFMILAGYVVRAYERRHRRRSRGEVAELQRAFVRFLAEESDAETLHREIGRATSAAFWTALEPSSLSFGYVRWLRLSRALEPNRFSRGERRAL